MSGAEEPFVWGVIANVRAVIPCGPGGEHTQSGLKHFAPGTKVWVLPHRWDPGLERVRVIGRHRGGTRLVKLIVPVRSLENFRVAGVYRAGLWRQMGRDGWDTKEAAQMAAEQWASESTGEDRNAGH